MQSIFETEMTGQQAACPDSFEKVAENMMEAEAMRINENQSFD